MRQHLRHGLVPPRQAAQVGLRARKVTPGLMHARQHRADLRTVIGVRRELVATRQAIDQRGGLAFERVQQRAARVGLRHRHRDAALRQVAHQLQVEGQLFESQALEERQHPMARRASVVLCVDEEVAVFDASLDATQAGELPG